MVTQLVNMRKTKNFDIRIDRYSIWGNPFILHDPNDSDERTQVIAQYEEYIRKRPDLLDQLSDLVGKRLGCWCAPKPCHGDILIKLIKEKGLE